MRWWFVILLAACSKGPPALPELDPAGWRHVLDLAKPARPNGSVKDLELVIDIANRNHWSETAPDKPLGELDTALIAMRRWRDTGGGVVLIHPVKGSNIGAAFITSGLLTSNAPDAIALVTELGVRSLEQADSALNLAVATDIVSRARDRAKQRGETFVFDVANWRRGIVRGVAGEVVWMRKLRVLHADTGDRADLEVSDRTIAALIEALRGVREDTTEAQLLDKVRASKGDERMQRSLVGLLERFRDDGAKVFAP